VPYSDPEIDTAARQLESDRNTGRLEARTLAAYEAGAQRMKQARENEAPSALHTRHARYRWLKISTSAGRVHGRFVDYDNRVALKALWIFK
jgi:hypothetical protein